MKRAARMMLMSGGGRNRNGNSRSGDGYARDNYGGYDTYEMEDKFRDRRGREHYDNGRYAPMRGDGDMWVDSKFRDRDGRWHYDNGKFAPRDSYDDGYGAEMHYPYPMTPYVPPVYQNYDRQSDRRGYERRESGRRDSRPMNKIGFSLAGEMDKIPPREFNQDYSGDEMSYRRGERMSGYSSGDGYIPFSKEMAEEWTSHMENEDGTRGPHWTMDQTKQVQAQRSIDCDPLEFWAAINMIYSDYCRVAKELNVNTIDFYAKMANAFLDDEDAPEDKLARYYVYIASAKE